MDEPKIAITGTGRAGTTAARPNSGQLGLDTGIGTDKLLPYMPGVRAGLECRVDEPDAPTVVKDMTLGFRMRDILDRGEVQIGHVIIPTRRLDIAVASRIRAADYGKRPFRGGALTGTLHATEQERVLVAMRDEIIDALQDHAVPYTLIEFPRFASDAAYARDRLSVVVPTATLADFERALSSCVQPELIHEVPLSWQERWRMRATSAWMRCFRYPWRPFDEG